MAKIKLQQEQTKLDLAKLLSMNEVVPTKVESKVVPTKQGKFDSYAEDYPEYIKVRARAGTKEMLKGSATKRGFGSVSKLIRSALVYALSHEDFVEGWDK